jgi:magnesium transporter
MKVSCLLGLQQRNANMQLSFSTVARRFASTAAAKLAVVTKLRTWDNGFQWVDVSGPEVPPDASALERRKADDQFSAAVGPMLLRAGASPAVQWRNKKRQPLPTMVVRGRTGALETDELCAVFRFIPRPEVPLPPPTETAANRAASWMRTETEESAGPAEESIEHMTQRVTLVILPAKIITIHRYAAGFLTPLRLQWDDRFRGAPPIHLVHAIVKQCGNSFQLAARYESATLEGMETAFPLSVRRPSNETLQLLHIVSRRASIQCRVLKPMEATYLNLCHSLGADATDVHVQDVLSMLSRASMLSQDARDSTMGLMSLHFQRSAHELENMIRMLTLFSAVFIPLEFLTACFGMNVEWWPWMSEESGGGFRSSALLMASSVTATIAWFRFRKFV